MPAAACWSQEEKRGKCELANLLFVESDFGTTDKSFTVFLALEALNLIVKPNSLPVDFNFKWYRLSIDNASRSPSTLFFLGLLNQVLVFVTFFLH